MEVIFLTVFLSTILVSLFIVLFFKFEGKKSISSGLEQSSLLPLKTEEGFIELKKPTHSKNLSQKTKN